MPTLEHPVLGHVWLKDPGLSVPGRPTSRQRGGVVVACQLRPRGVIDGTFPQLPDVEQPGAHPENVHRKLLLPFRELVAPEKFRRECIWASITPNERVDKGGGIMINRLFGTVGASNGVATAMAVASASLTKAHTDLSLGSGSASVTTNEFTTIGLSRVTATVQNYVAATSLNGVASADNYYSFSVTGSGTAYGAGLFDSTTVSGSFLLCEDNFSASAAVVNLDVLQITWTYSG